MEKMTISKTPAVKIYDKDNNEIIPPEGATGWVQGMNDFAWTFDKPDYETKFIYNPPDEVVNDKEDL